MKKLLLAILLLSSVTIFSQEITKSDIEGKWTFVETQPAKKKFRHPNRMKSYEAKKHIFKNMTLELKENGDFDIFFPNNKKMNNDYAKTKNIWKLSSNGNFGSKIDLIKRKEGKAVRGETILINKEDEKMFFVFMYTFKVEMKKN